MGGGAAEGWTIVHISTLKRGFDTGTMCDKWVVMRWRIGRLCTFLLCKEDSTREQCVTNNCWCSGESDDNAYFYYVERIL